jgi:hypothetical protein
MAIANGLLPCRPGTSVSREPVKATAITGSPAQMEIQ